MTRSRLVTAMFAATVGLAPAAFASSHREAPLITQTPKLDGTDFYLFRSYESGRSAFVTTVANYLPLQDGYGGPNYFTLDPNAVYDINIDNKGDAQPAMTFRFRFQQADRGLALNVGGQSVPSALTELGQVTAPVPATQNVIETFTLSLVTYAGGVATEAPITNAATGAAVFNKPVDDIGIKTIPNYPAYASQFVYSINVPGCPTAGRAFVGQRKDSFVVNLGETFDLINYANPVGEQFSNTAANSIGDKNITSLELELPIACLVNGVDPVIGGWTTSSTAVKNGAGKTVLTQVSRLANPLVNELVIGLPDKDGWNASPPPADGNYFLRYFTNPTYSAYIEGLFGVKAPTTFPRADMIAVFLTGLSGLNQSATQSVKGDEIRLNTSIAPVPKGRQNRLGMIGGDDAGYPNGRRPGDDSVDIFLRIVMGKLIGQGLFPGNAPGALDFTDGACVNSSMFDATFPYLTTPVPGSSQAVQMAASTNGEPENPGPCGM